METDKQNVDTGYCPSYLQTAVNRMMHHQGVVKMFFFEITTQREVLIIVNYVAVRGVFIHHP